MPRKDSAFDAVSWAYRQTLTSEKKFTLVTMAHFADQHGYTTVNVTEIASYTGASEKTVRRHLRELERLEIIDVFRRYDKQTGARLDNAYRLFEVKNAPQPLRKFSHVVIKKGSGKDAKK